MIDPRNEVDFFPKTKILLQTYCDTIRSQIYYIQLTFKIAQEMKIILKCLRTFIN